MTPILGSMDIFTWEHEFHLQVKCGVAKRECTKAKSSVISTSTHGAMKCQLEGECEELMERPKIMWNTCV